MESGPRHRQRGRAVGSQLRSHSRAKYVAFLVGALMASTAAPAPAQLIHGTLEDQLRGSPIAGAFVVLTDSAGTELMRTLTDAQGRFMVRASAGGTFRLRTLVVGYRKWESEPFDLARGQTVERRIVLDLVPIALPAVTVEAERTCRVRPGEGYASAALWEEIKKALKATEWTIDRHLYRFRSEVSERSRDLHLTVTSDTTRRDLGYSIWPFRGLDPNRLVAAGFVQGHGVEGPTYYGPDAQVLVSDPFLDTHCFRLEESPTDTERLLGLAFEPAGERNVPDIAGVLWVDTTSMALRELDYHYVNLGKWVPERETGGSIEFARLPNGAWVIREWSLRAPIPRIWERPGRVDTTLYGYRERSGEVLEILNAAGESLVRFPRR